MAFSFGGSAPAPSGGFNFGGLSAAPTSATGTSTGTTAGTGFGTAPSSSGTGSFSFSSSLGPSGGSSAMTSAVAPGAGALVASRATLQMPSFDETFGNLALWNKIQKLSMNVSSTDLQGQELFHAITHTYRQCLKPKLPDWTAPNASLRQQLAQNPTIGIGGDTDSEGTATTTLTPKVLERILQLSTDLRIPEDQATTLYAQISSELETFQAVIPSSIVDQAGLAHRLTPTTLAARDFFFYERHLLWKTLLFLFQSRLSNESPYLVQATDVLLQDGLIQDLIRTIQESTQRIVHLMQELTAAANANRATSSFFSGTATDTSTTSTTHETKTNFANVHLLFYQQERQVACEILFFIAYHTQWTMTELVALLDLIRDLTQHVPVPCPFANVPSPYGTLSPTWPATLQEKSFFAWQADLVEQVHQSGHPAMLQCLSLLLVTAMTAMDTRQELWDRESHECFPRGNQFLPSGAGFAQLSPLQSRLNMDTIAAWPRPDIGGVLTSSYTLLLRTAGPFMGSPQAGHSDAPYIQAARDMSTAADLKSFTFTRLTLIPCLQRIHSACSICQVSEFALAVVAEQFSQYLDSLPAGQLPLSRQRWLIEEEEQLQLRRDNLARAQQFEAWQGGAYGSRLLPNQQQSLALQEAIPTSVDLMTRPDCLDDLVALAVDICSLGKDYARNFITTTSTITDGIIEPLTVCRTLMELYAYQTKDTTLLPGYLSWLAALCHDTTSANLVYTLLSKSSSGPQESSTNTNEAATAATSSSAAASKNNLHWAQIIGNLRWYAQELSPYDSDVVQKPKATASTNKSNTSYYYSLEGDIIQESNNRSNKDDSTAPPTTSSATTSASTDTNKTKELSDSSRYYLASHLAVLRNVSRHSEQARHAILSITLPFGTVNTTSATTGDETLLILFKLAIAPLPPTIRGATLATIASLLQSASTLSPEQQKFLRDQAQHGWDYLETCPLLPIALLDQYQVVQQGVRVGLAVPPSSIALANSSTGPSLLPKDPYYGLFYEMEHVESQLGWYPSTEGCLELLLSLVSTGGCSSKLGQNWRVRSGATPYIEYVTDFVLPRIMGTKNSPRLYFRVPGDQSRLLTKALGVLEAVLIRYNLPPTATIQPTPTLTEVSTLLGIPCIANQVMVPSNGSDQQYDLAEDFKNLSTTTMFSPTTNTDYSGNNIYSGASSSSLTLTIAPAGSVPRAKSPAFCLLADLLSLAEGSLLEVLALILVQHGGPGSIQPIFGTKGDEMALAYAAFGSTIPNLLSALEGAKDGEPTKPQQTLLKPLLPAMEDLLLDSTTFDNGATWREKSIVLALRILCAAAVREEQFVNAVAACPEPLKIVPVLRFQPILFGSSNLKVIDVALSRLSTLLYSTTNSQYIRQAIVNYIGYKSFDDKVDAELSGTALSLAYVLHPKTRGGPSRAFMGSEIPKILSTALANRFLIASRRLVESPLDAQTTTLILNWILTELRLGAVTEGGLVSILLGLPSDSSRGNWSPDRTHYATSNEDCLDAILEFLQGVEYSSSNEQAAAVASSCFEILFRLYDLPGKVRTAKSMRVVVYTAQRLRAMDFWNSQLLLWLSSRGPEPLRQADSHPEVMHSLAWLLKGLACELHLLVGFADISMGVFDAALTTFMSPRPLLYQRFMDVMFGSEEPLMIKLIASLPLGTLPINPELLHPPQDALRAGMENWPGSHEVVEGYYRVDKIKVLHLIQTQWNEADRHSMEKWIDAWNSIVARNCATSHLANAVSMVVDSALAGRDAFQYTGVDQISMSIPPSSIVDLTTRITHCLLEGSTDRVAGGMDWKLHSNATRNLSNAVLRLVDALASLATLDQPNATELLHLVSLLARTITYSSIGDEYDAEAPMRYERTTVLASALSLLLRVTSKEEPDLLVQYRDDLLLAATALAKLALFEVNSLSSSQDSKCVVAVLARSSLATIIEACSEIDEGKASSFVSQFMATTVARSFTDLVARLDMNICSLLQSVGSQPYGAESLIYVRVLDAVESAATTYAKQEADLTAKLQKEAGSYRQVKILAPDFLMGHLKLLSTIMASNTLPPQYLQHLPQQVMKILRHYKVLFHRLCYNFPFESDLLRAFLRCFLDATALSLPVDPNDRYNQLTPSFRRTFQDLFSEEGFWENGVLMLCKQLLENPLPSSLLPTPPPGLVAPEQDTLKDGLVKLDADRLQSWWDVLEVLLSTKQPDSSFLFDTPVGRGDFGYWGVQSPTKWSENKFEYAIVAADVLSLCLSLLRKHDRHGDINGFVLARGLHQLTLASQAMARRIEEVCLLTSLDSASMRMETEESNNENAALEEEYLRLLGSSFARCVEEVLVIAYRSLTASTKENNYQGRNHYLTPEQVRLSIDHSGLTNAGVGCLAELEHGPERVEFISSVTKQLLATFN